MRYVNEQLVYICILFLNSTYFLVSIDFEDNFLDNDYWRCTMKESINEIVKILNSIKTDLLVSDELVLWTSYDNVDDLKKDMTSYINRLEQQDFAILSDIETLFAPTGVLQEVSISGNWGIEFIEMGNDIDSLIKTIKDNM